MGDLPPREAFESALRQRKFRDLVNELQQRGFDQVAIYVLFEVFAVILRDEHREADCEAVEDGALDLIWGWCSKYTMLFHEGLTQAKVDAFRKSNEGFTKRVLSTWSLNQ